MNEQPVIHESSSSRSSLSEGKKKIIVLGLIALAAGYILLSGDSSSPEPSPGLDSELQALQQEREASPRNVNAGYDGTDNRGISLGSGSSAANADPGAFQTQTPLVRGILVGYGTKTDMKGEYLVLYVSVPETAGYEVDMREITGYSLEEPVYLDVGREIRVYGEWVTKTEIRAEVVQ